MVINGKTEEENKFLELIQLKESDFEERQHDNNGFESKSATRIINWISYSQNDIENILHRFYGERLRLLRLNTHYEIDIIWKPCNEQDCIYIDNAIVNIEWV